LEPPLWSYLQINFSTFTQGHIFELCLLLVLLVISALLSATEVAYFSLSPQHIDALKNADTKGSRRILRHLSKPNDLLSTILLYNNLVNVAFILLSTYLVNSWIDFSQSPLMGFLVETAALTFLLVFCGEITPKIVAAQYPNRIANFMAAPLQVLIKLSQPFNRLTMYWGSSINKRFGNRGSVSIDELSQAVDITTAASAEDKKILKGIVRYVNIDVKSIMIPRVKMAAIEIHTSFPEVRRQMIDSGYSRIPVYDKSLDTICGFLSVKDFLPYIDVEDEQFHWQHLLRKAYFIPEQKKINDLLEEFRQKKIHLAIVVDEFGGTEGLVTLEDILEEIVGEISDESD
jgi:gliding motility-associated protein GldE